MVGTDIMQAARALIRRPRFSVLVTFVLTLGIGTGAAMIAIAQATLTAPLPVHDAEQVRLLQAFTPTDGIGNIPLRASHFLRFRGAVNSASAVVAVQWVPPLEPMSFRLGEETVRLNHALVGGEFFEVLGVPLELGQSFAASDDVFGAAPVMVLSHRAWREHFQSDPGIVGRVLTTLDRSRDFQIVGVAPASFDYPVGSDMWTPVIPLTTAVGSDTSAALVDPLVRLRPGASASQAVEEYTDFLRSDPDLVQLGGGRPSGQQRPIRDVIMGEARPLFALLGAAIALLFVIVASNVANLILVRGAMRRGEVALRRSLGAGRWSVARQLVGEAAILTALSGVLALPLARALMWAYVQRAPDGLPRIEAVGEEGFPWAPTGLLTIAMFLVVGLAPAFYVAGSVRLHELLHSTRGGARSRQSRLLQSAVVVWQIALTLVVVNAATLVGLSLMRLQSVPTGFDPSDLYIAELSWSGGERGDDAREFFRAVVGELEDQPAVVASSVVLDPPFVPGWIGRYVLDGQTEEDALSNPWLVMNAGGQGLLATLGLPLVRGRGFTDADTEGVTRVVMVSEEAARRLWPGQDPLGRRIRLRVDQADDRWLTVVGVVAESRYRDLRDTAPAIYYPHEQFRRSLPNRIAIRTAPGRGSDIGSLTNVMESVDPRVEVARVTSIADLMKPSFDEPRAVATLVTGFAGVGLILSMVGIYGLLAAMVRSRYAELAIRQALGARPADVVSAVVRHGLTLAGTGALVGVLIAIAAGAILQTQLFEVAVPHWGALSASTVILVVAAVIAAYSPARGAVRVQPRSALSGSSE